MQADMSDRHLLHSIVPLPGGAEAFVLVEPARKVGFWLHGIWRIWSTITFDKTTWVTVSRSDKPWPVIREKWDSEELAVQRGRQLVDELAAAGAPTGLALWRRRRTDDVSPSPSRGEPTMM